MAEPESETVRRSNYKKRVVPKDLRYDDVDHFIMRIERDQDNSNKDFRERCKHCKAKTPNMCQKCIVSLCHSSKRDCFKEYHTPE